jgi:hypothetical protein
MYLSRFLLLIFISLTSLLTGCQTLHYAVAHGSTVELHYPLWQYARTEIRDAAAQDAPHIPVLNRSLSGTPLLVNGLSFDHGISFGGNAVLVYEINGHGSLLQMMAGIDDSTGTSDARAEITVRGNGYPLYTKTLVAGDDPKEIEIPLDDVDRIVIHISAPSQVVTDILLPRMIGDPGLLPTIEKAREEWRDTVLAAPAATSAMPVECINKAIVFSADVHGFPGCIAMTNMHAAVVIDPNQNGELVFYGRDLDASSPLISGAHLDLHPHSRQFVSGITSLPHKWKWRIERDGTLRLLSPRDPVYGVRYSRTYYFLPDSPVLRVSSLLKNDVSYDISRSLGSSTKLSPHATIVLPREEAAPGYSLISPPDMGITVEDTYVFVSPSDAWRYHTSHSDNHEQILHSHAGNWWCAFVPESAVIGVFPGVPDDAQYFPYTTGAARIRTTANAAYADTYSEITRLSSEEYITLHAYWCCAPEKFSTHDAIEWMKKKVAEAEATFTSRSGLGRPTGRELK